MTKSKRRSTRKIKVDGTRGIYSALGYRSVRAANSENRSPVAGSGSQHQETDRPLLINQSRDFTRDNGIYAGMIERANGYIIGNGFQLQSLTGNKAYDDQLEKLWRQFWKSPEIKNVLSGRNLERMVCSEILTCGDTGLIMVDSGKLQHVEAEQIAAKNFRDGIEKDAYGAPKNFFVAPYKNYGGVDTTQAQPYSPDVFCFITKPDRPSSIRGVPPLQASFPMLHRINDVCDSEAVAWQMLARYAVAVTRQAGAEQGYEESMADDKKSSDSLTGDTATRITELDYAMIFHGEPGDEVRGIDRNIPGQNFTESLMMFLRLLGLPLGLPLEIILLDWTKSNYSQSRAVLEQAYQAFLGWQMLIEESFLDRVLAWKVKGWEVSGDLDGEYGDEILEYATWIKPTFPWIDILKETQAYGEKISLCISTHAETCRSAGRERDDVVAAREKEIRDAIERSQKIKADTGVDIDWRLFAGLKADAPKATPAPEKKPDEERTDKGGDEENDGEESPEQPGDEE